MTDATGGQGMLHAYSCPPTVSRRPLCWLGRCQHIFEACQLPRSAPPAYRGTAARKPHSRRRPYISKRRLLGLLWFKYRWRWEETTRAPPSGHKTLSWHFLTLHLTVQKLRDECKLKGLAESVAEVPRYDDDSAPIGSLIYRLPAITYANSGFDFS